MVKVSANTFLVAIGREVHGRFAMPQRREAAAIVAARGPFDLDYSRTKVAEQLRAVRPRDVLRQVNDRQSVEYCRHPAPALPTRCSRNRAQRRLQLLRVVA
jgi:hypothetical protein